MSHNIVLLTRFLLIALTFMNMGFACGRWGWQRNGKYGFGDVLAGIITLVLLFVAFGEVGG